MSQKDTNGKLKLNLIPPRALEAIAQVREFGNNKYGSAWGWLEEVNADDLIEAAKRHLIKLDKGETDDTESGLNHLWHALTSLAMAVELKERAFENTLKKPDWNTDTILKKIRQQIKENSSSGKDLLETWDEYKQEELEKELQDYEDIMEDEIILSKRQAIKNMLDDLETVECTLCGEPEKCKPNCIAELAKKVQTI